MAYLLFVMKNWEPSRYYDMSYGEKIVTRAFLKKQIEEEKEAHKK